jgi:hypothetical protein
MSSRLRCSRRQDDTEKIALLACLTCGGHIHRFIPSSLTVNCERNACPPDENLGSLGERLATETFLTTADQILLTT